MHSTKTVTPDMVSYVMDAALARGEPSFPPDDHPLWVTKDNPGDYEFMGHQQGGANLILTCTEQIDSETEGHRIIGESGKHKEAGDYVSVSLRRQNVVIMTHNFEPTVLLHVDQGQKLHFEYHVFELKIPAQRESNIGATASVIKLVETD